MTGKTRMGMFVLAGLAASVLLVLCVAPFASSSPDGLEKVAQDQGVSAAAQAPAWRAPLPDYEVPGVRRKGLSTALAGAIGTLGVFGVTLLVARLLARRAPPAEREAPR